ncbi:hypothetical protein NUKP84_50410 [Klebsiella variicola]|nr:hypothetical protein NUKP84_50410 [Klebsiella variicola]
MTCSKLDDSAINGSGYAVTTVRLEREADGSGFMKLIKASIIVMNSFG